MDAVTHLLSDARGIYIPRDFLECFDPAQWGLTEANREQWQDAQNPDSEWYWDTWDWVLDHARFTSPEGDVYSLYQDGDLWALCYEKMTDEEKSNFGFTD